MRDARERAEFERRLAAYEASASDAEAAQHVGLDRATFRHWRHRHGLPAKNDPTGDRLDPEQDRQRRRLHAQGLSDGQAAARLGIAPNTFNYWRHRQGFPANGTAGPLTRQQTRLRHELWRRGLTASAAARRIGVSVSAMTAWRRRQLRPKPASPLPRPGRPRRLDPQEEKRRRRAYENRSSDIQAARQLALDPLIFYQWRRSRGHPAKGRRPLRVNAAEDERRLRVWQRCDSDWEAARRLGIGFRALYEWRCKRGLRPHRPMPPPFTTEDQRWFMRAYCATSNDVDAARRLGVGKASFRAWRLHQGLPSRAARGATLRPEVERRRKRIYWSSPNDKDAARRMRVSYGAYLFWRLSRELPPRRRTGQPRGRAYFPDRSAV